ncbi:hypothetical protein [Actinomadura formosensis]|uniref:hypothetical protein n=1 Tax=Actinomadura formosensis TaxID=60706 RepID=UPI000AF6AA18|nr:hypothetical protein [Actinomadura formosensis]
MRLPPRVAAITAALLLTGGLAGCSPSGGDSGTASSSGGGEAVSAAGGVGFDSPSKPVAKGTFDTPIAAGAKVDIAILGLRARGRLATLNIQLTPHVPGAESTSSSITPFNLNGGLRLGTSLIDPVNLKRYVVVKDSSGAELQPDEIYTTVANDQPVHLSYTFAAPPENVKVVDVQIGSWPTFRNVPVER